MDVINVYANLQIFPVRIIPSYFQEFDFQIVFDTFQKYPSSSAGYPDDMILGLVYGMGWFPESQAMIISKYEQKIQEFALPPTFIGGEVLLGQIVSLNELISSYSAPFKPNI